MGAFFMEQSTMSIQALREQRAAKAKALNELVGKAEWKAEVDQPIYDAGMAELDEIDAKINRINAVNAKVAEEALTHQVAERAERAGVDNKSDGAKIYAKWLRGGDAALSAQDWQTVRNTMSVGTGSQGGYTVATEVATSGARRAEGVWRNALGGADHPDLAGQPDVVPDLGRHLGSRRDRR
jgi:HK97 family phage major capsid protein